MKNTLIDIASGVGCILVLAGMIVATPTKPVDASKDPTVSACPRTGCICKDICTRQNNCLSRAAIPTTKVFKKLHFYMGADGRLLKCTGVPWVNMQWKMVVDGCLNKVGPQEVRE